MPTFPETYWMVHNPQRGAPTMQHTTIAGARREANRLSKLHPGERFYVLEQVGMAYTEREQWRPVTEDDIGKGPVNVMLCGSPSLYDKYAGSVTIEGRVVHVVYDDGAGDDPFHSSFCEIRQ